MSEVKHLLEIFNAVNPTDPTEQFTTQSHTKNNCSLKKGGNMVEWSLLKHMNVLNFEWPEIVEGPCAYMC